MIKNKPEAYGISSDNLLCMVQELETFVEDIHSISVVCDNDVIFSKCIQPYTEEPMQMLHSFSKSMNSIAVGIAIDEGKLHLDDLVIDYFKEYLPEEYDKRIDQLTVRNLLTMAANSCRLSTCFRGVTDSWITHYFKVNVNIAIILASFCCVILYWNTTPKKLNLIDDGVKRASMVIMNTAAVVGFGYVVKSTVGFQNLIDMLSNLGGNPLISFASATTLIAGATGSGSGGIGIAMEVFAQKYMDLGVNPEVLHRIAAIACNGLDTLPHNSMVITCLAACGMTHKESYKPIFITSVCITLIGLAFAVFLGIAFY